MTIGGSFPGTGAYMSYTTDQLRKDNGLTDYQLSPEEEEIKVFHVPERLSVTPPKVTEDQPPEN